MKNTLSGSASAAALILFIAPAFAGPSPAIPDDEDTIIVTGSPIPKAVGDALVGVSVVEGADLARNASSSLGDALRREPGISSSFFGAGASRPIIRGQGGDRIRVLDNGIGSIDASAASPDHATAVSPAIAERIEIVRGAGLLRYGSSAAGGVINVIDGRLPNEAPEDGIEGAFRVGTTSVDDGTEAAGAITATLGKWGNSEIVGYIGGTWREADDYDIPGFAESARLRAAEEEEHEDEDEEEEEEARDTLGNSFVETDSIAAGLGFIGSRGFLSVGVKSTNSEYGIPGGHGHEEHHDEDEDEDEDEEEEEEEENVFIALEQTRVDINGQLELDGAFEAINLYAGVADYSHTEFEAPGEPGTVFSNEGWEARIELTQAARGGWRGASGIQYRDRDFAAVGDEAFVPPTKSTQIGLFTFQEYGSGPWTIESAVRAERTEHTRSTDNTEISFDGISGSAGLRYEFADDWTIGGTVFRTERAPTSEELFSNGPHLATSQFERGDITLDMEISTGIEGVLRWDGADGHVAVNIFHTNYDDYIYERQTTDEEDDLPVFVFTASDATFSGVEVEWEHGLGRLGSFDMEAELVVDMVDASLDQGGKLPRIPPMSATLGVSANSPQLTISGEVEYAAEQDEVTSFELPTDSYTLVNTYADWSPFGADHPISVSASVHNLFDEEAREATSFLKDLVPLPGRNVRMSVRYTF